MLVGYNQFEKTVKSMGGVTALTGSWYSRALLILASIGSAITDKTPPFQPGLKAVPFI
jgi:hypothetical protein